MVETLRVGNQSAEVGNLQRFLNRERIAVAVDEAFGPKTARALGQWQKAAGLPDNGQVDAPTRAILIERGFVPFIAAKNFLQLYPKTRERIDWITIHTMEYPEKMNAAEEIGLWFGGLTKYPPPMASAHYGVDPNGVVQYVRESDVAYHAPGANARGIGIELAGRAMQTTAQWEDAESQAILLHAAKLVADISKRRNIPPVRLSPADLERGDQAGIFGHIDATLAFPKAKGTHTDPGPHFPWVSFLALISEFV